MASRSSRLQPFGLLLAAALALPALPVQAAPGPSASAEETLIAGKGKGGSPKASGSSRKSGGSGHKSSSASKSHKGGHGMKHADSSFSKGSNKPSGGWSSSSRKKDGPSLDKPKKASDQHTRAQKHDNKGHKDDKSKSKQDKLDRREAKLDKREDKLDHRDKKLDKRADHLDHRDKKLDKRADRWDDWDRWDDRWDRYPGWARPGWGYARPWDAGWYGRWSQPSWSWWGAEALSWGINALTTAAIINSAVDNAVNDHVTTIVVPNSDYRLLYGSVAPSGNQSVTFEVELGNSELEMAADCNRGTLNGRNPSSLAEAELLNAACQVAYGAV